MHLLLGLPPRMLSFPPEAWLTHSSLPPGLRTGVLCIDCPLDVPPPLRHHCPLKNPALPWHALLRASLPTSHLVESHESRFSPSTPPPHRHTLPFIPSHSLSSSGLQYLHQSPGTGPRPLGMKVTLCQAEVTPLGSLGQQRPRRGGVDRPVGEMGGL